MTLPTFFERIFFDAKPKNLKFRLDRLRISLLIQRIFLVHRMNELEFLRKIFKVTKINFFYGTDIVYITTTGGNFQNDNMLNIISYDKNNINIRCYKLKYAFYLNLPHC